VGAYFINIHKTKIETINRSFSISRGESLPNIAARIKPDTSWPAVYCSTKWAGQLLMLECLWAKSKLTNMLERRMRHNLHCVKEGCTVQMKHHWDNKTIVTQLIQSKNRLVTCTCTQLNAYRTCYCTNQPFLKQWLQLTESNVSTNKKKKKTFQIKNLTTQLQFHMKTCKKQNSLCKPQTLGWNEIL
jgi:hypothetical protein